MDIDINLTGRNELVLEIDRFIWTIQERVQVIANQLAFEKCPHIHIVEIVYNIMFWINCFPHKDGIHDIISPRIFLTGLRIDHDKYCKLEFGTYVQIHKEHDNSLMACTTGVIALRPSDNTQWSNYFLNNNSGRWVTQNNWTVLPVPNDVIYTVHRLAVECKKYTTENGASEIKGVDRFGNCNTNDSIHGTSNSNQNTDNIT